MIPNLIGGGALTWINLILVSTIAGAFWSVGSWAASRLLKKKE